MPTPKVKYDIEAMDKSARGFASFARRMDQVTQRSGRMTRMTTALDKVTFGRLGGQFRGLAENIGAVSDGAAHLIDTLGAGEAAVIGTGAAVVGLAAAGALATKWAYDFTKPLAQSAVQLQNQSRVLGINTRDLQRYRNANTLAGGSADDMSAALDGMATVLNDARFGRNNQAVFLLNQLGVKSRDAKTAIFEVADAFDRMKNLSPQSKVAMAQALGLGSIAPQLLQGGAAMRANLAAANAGVNDKDLAKLAETNRRNAELGASWQATKSAFGANVLAPWLNPTLHGLTTFMTNLGDARYWQPLKRDSKGVLRSGFEPQYPGQATPAPTAAPARPATTDAQDIPSMVLKKAMARGFTYDQAAGIAAGMYAESRFDPEAIGPKWGAYGLGQVLGPRKQALFARYGRRPSAEQQIDYLLSEMFSTEAAAGASIARAPTASAAARAYIDQFMRPAAGAETFGDYNRAQQFLASMPPQQVEVSISLKGAPEGTTSVVRTTGPNISAGLKTVGPMGMFNGH